MTIVVGRGRPVALASGAGPDRHLLIENSIFDDVRVRASRQTRSAPENHEPVRFGADARVILYAGTFEAYQASAFWSKPLRKW